MNDTTELNDITEHPDVSFTTELIKSTPEIRLFEVKYCHSYGGNYYKYLVKIIKESDKFLAYVHQFDNDTRTYIKPYQVHLPNEQNDIELLMDIVIDDIKNRIEYQENQIGNPIEIA